MGYRSDVAITMQYDDYIYGLKWMKAFKFNDDENLLLPQNCDKIIRRDDKIILFYSCVKWYEWTFESIMILYEFLSSLDDKGLSFGFLRIGEDDADNEFGGDTTMLYETGVLLYRHIDLSETDTDKLITPENMNELKSENSVYRIIVNL